MSTPAQIAANQANAKHYSLPEILRILDGEARLEEVRTSFLVAA